MSGKNIDKDLKTHDLTKASQLLEQTLKSDDFRSVTRAERIAWLDKYFNALPSVNPQTDGLRLKLAFLLVCDLIEAAGKQPKIAQDGRWLFQLNSSANYLIQHEFSTTSLRQLYWVAKIEQDGRNRSVFSSKGGLLLRELLAVSELRLGERASDIVADDYINKAADDYLIAAQSSRDKGNSFEYERFMKAAEQICATHKTDKELEIHTIRAEEFLSKKQLDKAEAELVMVRRLSNGMYPPPPQEIARREKAENTLRSLQITSNENHPEKKESREANTVVKP